MTTDAIREALFVALREYVYETTHLSSPYDNGDHPCLIKKVTLDRARAAIAAYEAAQAKAAAPAEIWTAEDIARADAKAAEWAGHFAAPADGEPDAEAFSVALDTLRNRLGGMIRPYEVEEFAKVLHAFAARRVAEAVAAERAKPDASESAAKIWYERIDKQPTVHGKIEELSAVIAEARQAGESAMRETAVRTAGAWVNKSASAMRLAAGEMTAQEIRTAQAIAAIIAGEISRALPDNT